MKDIISFIVIILFMLIGYLIISNVDNFFDKNYKIDSEEDEDDIN